MDVADGSVDLVLCSMALHWFTERAPPSPDGARAGPGGVLGHPRSRARPRRRDHLAASAAPATPSSGGWPTRSRATRSTRTCSTGHLVAAGLEPLDVFTETRRRATPAAFYSGRLDAVASHLWADLPPAQQEETLARMHALHRERRRPRGPLPLRLRQDLRDRARPGLGVNPHGGVGVARLTGRRRRASLLLRRRPCEVSRWAWVRRVRVLRPRAADGDRAARAGDARGPGLQRDERLPRRRRDHRPPAW